ncbi:MAG: hypothetical protein K1Y36_11430 [Blastocatellia bacterium]|nr:hypothetical protein [Blastocatellia bacterium]
MFCFKRGNFISLPKTLERGDRSSHPAVWVMSSGGNHGGDRSSHPAVWVMSSGGNHGGDKSPPVKAATSRHQ